MYWTALIQMNLTANQVDPLDFAVLRAASAAYFVRQPRGFPTTVTPEVVFERVLVLATGIQSDLIHTQRK